MTKQVFIIHGWTYSLDKWTELVSELKNRNIKAELLRVPGLTEPSLEVWDIDGYVTWLNDKLKDVKNPILIGHSNGGRISLAFDSKHPGKLGQLILIDSAGVAQNGLLPKAKLKVLKIISKVGKVFSYIPPVKKAFYKLIGAGDYLNAPPNMKQTLQNMLIADNNIDLTKITVPTTIIWGRNDAITPLSSGQKIHSSITGSKLFIVDDARHAPFSSHPKEVADLIVNSLEPVKAKS